MRRLVYETSNVPCLQLVFKLWELWRLEPGPHSSSASSILAPHSWNFRRFQLYLLLLILPHLPASFGSADPNSAFGGGGRRSFPTCCGFVDLTSSSSVWNKQTNTRAAPPRLLPWCSSAQCGKSTPNADICHIHLAASVKPSLPFPPPPPQPNQVTSHFPAVSERASDGTRPNRPDGCFSSYLFMCLFLPPFLALPPPPVKPRKSCLVTSGVICARHNLRLHLWTRNRRRFHTSSVILSLTELVAKLPQDQRVDMFIIVLAITWFQRQLDVLLLSNNLLLFISDRPDRLTR